MEEYDEYSFTMPNRPFPDIPNPNIEQLEITHFEEIEQNNRTWFCFQINGIEYFMILDEDHYDSNTFIIESVSHREERCPFCSSGFVELGECQVFTNHAIALHKELIQHSKHRLRWLTRIITRYGEE